MEFIADQPGRLDALIAAQDGSLSRSKIQKSIKDGSVTVNREVITKPAFQLQDGDTVSIPDQGSPTTNHSVASIDQHLEVLFEDDAMLVLHKPAGIAVHPGHASDPNEVTLLSGIKYLFEQRAVPFSPDSTLVHRLDKPTTGCICIAKSDSSFANLQKQFEERKTKKTYLAVVAGVPEHTEATIDAPIGRNLTDRTKMSILKTSVSRDARTTYRIMDHSNDCALLECDLHTGRTHQIRVHLSSIGHPILGDETYGSPQSKKISDHYGVDGLCLHAWKIGFVSPADGKEHFVHAPISSMVRHIAHEAGLRLPSD